MQQRLNVPRLTATSFRRQLTSGRTRPCVFACETEDGVPAGEYVVKLRSRMELGDSAAARELIASLLAQALDLDVPDPAIVDIRPELASGIIQLDVRGDVRQSAGPNFGSRYLMGGWRAWQPNEVLLGRQLAAGFEIYTFDALIDNPDRSGKEGRPTNLLTDGNRIVVLDHESAFSFILALFAPKEPWTLSGSDYLREHIFYASLKSVLVSADRIHEALKALTPETLDAIQAAVPEGWHGPHVMSVRQHVQAIVEHADDFITAVKQSLR